MPNLNKLSVSNLLILACIMVTFSMNIFPDLVLFWINDLYLNQWNYVFFAAQIFMSQLLHGWLFHLAGNSLFLYLFGNSVEQMMWEKKFILFFLLNSIFLALMIVSFSNWNTIWISGFAMAILAYYTTDLYKRKNPEYKWWITALGLNIFIGFIPGISLLGHLFWAIFWVLYYFIIRLLKFH